LKRRLFSADARPGFFKVLRNLQQLINARMTGRGKPIVEADPEKAIARAFSVTEAKNRPSAN
jgi:hypothetical protein